MFFTGTHWNECGCLAEMWKAPLPACLVHGLAATWVLGALLPTQLTWGRGKRLWLKPHGSEDSQVEGQVTGLPLAWSQCPSLFRHQGADSAPCPDWLAGSFLRAHPLSVLLWLDISEGQPSSGDLTLLMVRYHPSHLPLGSQSWRSVFAEDCRMAFGSTFRNKKGEGHLLGIHYTGQACIAFHDSIVVLGDWPKFTVLLHPGGLQAPESPTSEVCLCSLALEIGPSCPWE